jgi:hypothetical protein
MECQDGKVLADTTPTNNHNATHNAVGELVGIRERLAPVFWTLFSSLGFRRHAWTESGSIL